MKGDEFTVRYAQDPPVVTSRQRVEMFERLASAPGEAANDE